MSSIAFSSSSVRADAEGDTTDYLEGYRSLSTVHHPLWKPEIRVTGWIYDLETGSVEKIHAQ
jgi:carbonic anhydrase